MNAISHTAIPAGGYGSVGPYQPGRTIRAPQIAGWDSTDPQTASDKDMSATHVERCLRVRVTMRKRWPRVEAAHGVVPIGIKYEMGSLDRHIVDNSLHVPRIGTS